MSPRTQAELSHPPLEAMELTAVMHALSDPTRLAIVRTLHSEPEGRGCGTFDVDVAASTLSHHFKVLRESGLIHQEARGTRRWTRLRSADLQARFPGLIDALMAVR